uniref:G-protein coupled receptors family 1 profile domain-containing protein n=1 Tax=Arion vulgaris TaxID=1028688 RepID=A0A0B6ZV07_9EUPU
MTFMLPGKVSIVMPNCINHTSIDNEYNSSSADMSMSSVINGTVLPVVCVFGVVGNLLNLAILTRRKLQKSFKTLEQAANICLVALAVSDLMFCTCAFLTVFLPSDNIYTDNSFWLFYGRWNVAIINVFIMESTLLTVAMSLERYLAICFPLRQNIYLTTSRIKLIITFTIIFSVCFNIPVIWRNEMVMICDPKSSDSISNINLTFGNITSLGGYLQQAPSSQISLDIPKDVTTPGVVLNDVFKNVSTSSDTRNLLINSTLLPLISSSSSISSTQRFSFPSDHLLQHLHASTYPTASTPPTIKTNELNTADTKLHTIKIVMLFNSNIYDNVYRVVWAFVGNFTPLILLLYFNVCLCRQIYRSYKLRKHLGRQNRIRRSSHVLTITLVAIVVLFFILVAPSEVTLQISRMTSSGDTPLYKNTEAVMNLMQSINFSVNFILYCIISPYFRKTLKYLMLCGFCQIRQSKREWSIKFDTSYI